MVVIRPGVIASLVNHACDAMESCEPNASTNEVASAVMTLALRVMISTEEQGGNMSAFQPVIEQMWMMLGSGKVKH